MLQSRLHWRFALIAIAVFSLNCAGKTPVQADSDGSGKSKNKLDFASCALVEAPDLEKKKETPDMAPAARKCASNVIENIDYFGDGLERHRMDLYLPLDLQSGPVPVVLQVHGGGYSGGNKEANVLRIAWLLQAKMAVASVNYRFLPQGGVIDESHQYYPAPLIDAKAAVRWLRANAEKYHIDANHIGAWGGSAGGHLVAMLGTTAGVPGLDDQGPSQQFSSAIQAVCMWYGSADPRLDGSQGGNRMNPIERYLGLKDLPRDEAEKLRFKISAVLNVTPDDPPLLSMFGDRDGLSLYEHTVRYERALKEVGVESDYFVIKGGGHGEGPFFRRDNIEMVQSFFIRHLRPSK